LIRCKYCDNETPLKLRKGYFCLDCREIVDDPIRIYECGECGTAFSQTDSYDGLSNRCPDCGRFGHTLIRDACPECEAEVELEKVKVYECPTCGEAWPSSEAYEQSGIWRPPFKRRQKLILVKPYVRGRIIKERYGYAGLEGEPPKSVERPTYLEIEKIEREKKLFLVTATTVYADRFGSRLPTYMNEDELKAYWKPVTDEEFEEWLKEALKQVKGG